MSVRYPASKTISEQDYTKPADPKLEDTGKVATRSFETTSSSSYKAPMSATTGSRYDDLPVRFRDGLHTFRRLLCFLIIAFLAKFDYKQKPQNPLYRTSNSVYGSKTPTERHMPTKFADFFLYKFGSYSHFCPSDTARRITVSLTPSEVASQFVFLY